MSSHINKLIVSVQKALHDFNISVVFSSENTRDNTIKYLGLLY